MTEEAKRCVEALRDNINNGFLLVGGFNGSVHASEIIHLIESLSAQLEQVEKERDGLNIMLAQAQAMLETRTKERDAAVRDMTLGRICETCRHHNNSATSKCMGCLSWHSNWQWRGVREVE